jgi:hypothetical protein
MSQQHLSPVSAEAASLTFAPAIVQSGFDARSVWDTLVGNKNLMLALRVIVIAAIWAGLFFAALNSTVPHH